MTETISQTDTERISRVKFNFDDTVGNDDNDDQEESSSTETEAMDTSNDASPTRSKAKSDTDIKTKTNPNRRRKARSEGKLQLERGPRPTGHDNETFRRGRITARGHLLRRSFSTSISESRNAIEKRSSRSLSPRKSALVTEQHAQTLAALLDARTQLEGNSQRPPGATSQHTRGRRGSSVGALERKNKRGHGIRRTRSRSLSPQTTSNNLQQAKERKRSPGKAKKRTGRSKRKVHRKRSNSLNDKQSSSPKSTPRRQREARSDSPRKASRQKANSKHRRSGERVGRGNSPGTTWRRNAISPQSRSNSPQKSRRPQQDTKRDRSNHRRGRGASPRDRTADSPLRDSVRSSSLGALESRKKRPPNRRLSRSLSMQRSTRNLLPQSQNSGRHLLTKNGSNRTFIPPKQDSLSKLEQLLQATATAPGGAHASPKNRTFVPPKGDELTKLEQLLEGGQTTTMPGTTTPDANTPPRSARPGIDPNAIAFAAKRCNRRKQTGLMEERRKRSRSPPNNTKNALNEPAQPPTLEASRSMPVSSCTIAVKETRLEKATTESVVSIGTRRRLRKEAQKERKERQAKTQCRKRNIRRKSSRCVDALLLADDGDDSSCDFSTCSEALSDSALYSVSDEVPKHRKNKAKQTMAKLTKKLQLKPPKHVLPPIEKLEEMESRVKGTVKTMMMGLQPKKGMPFMPSNKAADSGLSFDSASSLF